MRARRLVAAGLTLVMCAAVAGTALAAPASGGRHFPHFSLMNERVAVKKLPREVRWLVEGPPGAKGFGIPHLGHGPVWFGEVERPNATIAAAGEGRWICQSELPNDGAVGGSSDCTTLAAAREFGLLDISSCGKGRPTHFRVYALLPDGVTAVEVEKEDGTIGRTVPVIENTVAFTIGRENFALRGVGDAAAEALERNLPLADVTGGDGRAGCTSYSFMEAKSGG